MNNNDLVAKLWKLCDNLRDGGVSYQNYVNELASLLFLKMCKETGQEADYLPKGYRWDDLKSRIGRNSCSSTVTCWSTSVPITKSWCRRYSRTSIPPLPSRNS